MGVILTAVSKSLPSYDKLCRLYVAVQLWPNGIELKHVYGYPAALSEFKERLLRSASTRAVFSAGIGKSIDIELGTLHSIIYDLKDVRYNLLTFNCHHLASSIYLQFTGEEMREQLCQRWTENRSYHAKRSKMDWSRGIVELSDLTQVPGESCLFSHSPRFEINSGAFVGCVVGRALAFANPPLGLIVMAGSFASEAVPSF